MIVYGDTEFEATLPELIGRLERTLEGTDPASLDDLRRLLIQAGQVEQAWEDAQCDDVKAARRLTDTIGEAFVRRFRGANERGDFAGVEEAFARLTGGAQADLTVKIPEGFEFYSLYPEQYIVSAEEWNEVQRGRGANVIVVGIRSIGTTLSAVVQAVLRREGCRARRLTVRPGGHPFDRIATLPEDLQCDRAIVVDEGPGLSGSSMAAVAQALHARGVAHKTFLFSLVARMNPGSTRTTQCESGGRRQSGISLR